MSKIIGVTVGTRLPKPNFKQTDPTKGDYIKNKPDFEGLKNEVLAIGELVGDTKVSEQIANMSSELENKIYKQNEEPLEAEEGALWIDLDEEGVSGGVSSGGGSVNIDTTLTKSGQAADAKVVGDKFANLEKKINSSVTVSDDGDGNITFESITSSMSVQDDGDGNIIIS